LRIKTIEKNLPLDKIFRIIKKLFNDTYYIDKNSKFSQFSLLLICINTKNNTLIIRASKDREYERIYLSVLAFKSKYLIKKFNFKKDSKELVKNIGQKLFDLISSEGENAKSYPFTGLSFLKSSMEYINNSLIKTESFVLNEILKSLSENYYLNDNLIKFPFSITQIDGSWDFWQKIYSPYVTNIEKRWKNFDEEPKKIYKNYDFALEKDYFQRIFDLVVIEDDKGDFLSKLENSKSLSKSDILPKDEEESNESDKITKISVFFIYSNKTMKPIKLMNLLKRMNEIKTFSKQFQKNINTHNIEIKPRMILISLFGFSENVGNYLKRHIYRENEHAIPILIIPPVNNVWHNLRDYSELSQSDTELKSQLEKIIKIGKKIDNSSFLRNPE
jgi:hypothetical protein